MGVAMEAKVKEALRKYDSNFILKEKQLEAIFSILSGHDVLMNVPVGYGKSIVYHLLPSILESVSNSAPVVLVISPLNIIQKDQIATLSKHNVSACRLNINTKVEETTETGPDYESWLDVGIDGVVEGR